MEITVVNLLRASPQYMISSIAWISLLHCNGPAAALDPKLVQQSPTFCCSSCQWFNKSSYLLVVLLGFFVWCFIILVFHLWLGFSVSRISQLSVHDIHFLSVHNHLNIISTEVTFFPFF